MPGAIDYSLEVRLNSPGAAKKADYEGSRASAIHKFCEQCSCGKNLASTCPTYWCFLWQFRPNAESTELDTDFVPTLEEYLELLDEKTTDVQKKNWEKRAEQLSKKAPE